MNSASTHPAARPWLKRGIKPVGWRLALAVLMNVMNSATNAVSSPGAMVSSANPGVLAVTSFSVLRQT
jgi:hypothetical protein